MVNAARLLDSSVWIEIFGCGPHLKACLKELSGANEIIVPSLVVYEVYKRLTLITSDDAALTAVAEMAQYGIVDLTQEISLTAADLSMLHKLGMADSMILAHAQKRDATVITLDNNFAQVEGVKIVGAQ